MAQQIQLLTQDTIDKIAAGEVIERPASIVKELVENAIDAGASAITVEIREGGISFIRITDNGEGIPKEQIPSAFLRHATSKIRRVDDLLRIHSLGFRGEALSSIAAVCQVELITKTAGSLTGCRYQIEGGRERGLEEIGAPEGSTFLVRNIFYNTPARKKFLKSPAAEAGYISDLLERLALSHPEISVKFISSGQTKLHTSGNHNLKDIIYSIYGREITANLIPVEAKENGIHICGFIGKPAVSRGNRNFENYFVNGRYVKSGVIAGAIEEGYKNFLMQHRYPFTVLCFTMDGSLLDINVHPTKMELRFADGAAVHEMVRSLIQRSLSRRELIPDISLEEKKQSDQKKVRPALPSYPEPFEKNRLDRLLREKEAAYDGKPAAPDRPEKKPESPKPVPERRAGEAQAGAAAVLEQKSRQMELFDERLLSQANLPEHKLIGQVFDTYWLVQFRENLYIIDQHAAHEKVMYERLTASLKKKEFTTQRLSPPLILSLSMQEEHLLGKYQQYFQQVGFEIEPFGGREFAICGVPGNFFGVTDKELFLEMLDSLSEAPGQPSAKLLNEKLASMACKSAVKGNHRLSVSEANALIQELLSLENPYNCPHGRPTIISMSRYELEKKFKRII